MRHPHNYASRSNATLLQRHDCRSVVALAVVLLALASPALVAGKASFSGNSATLHFVANVSHCTPHARGTTIQFDFRYVPPTVRHGSSATAVSLDGIMCAVHASDTAANQLQRLGCRLAPRAIIADSPASPSPSPSIGTELQLWSLSVNTSDFALGEHLLTIEKLHRFNANELLEVVFVVHDNSDHNDNDNDNNDTTGAGTSADDENESTRTSNGVPLVVLVGGAFERHVAQVFEQQYGFESVVVREATSPALPLGWSVLWSIPYPFERFRTEMLELSDFQRVKGLPGDQWLTQPDLLCRRLMALQARWEHDFDFHPHCIVLPTQAAELAAIVDPTGSAATATATATLQVSTAGAIDESDPVWFVRPFVAQPSELESMAAALTRDPLTYAMTHGRNVYAQRYLESPLLIQGHVLEVRIFVMAAGVYPLRVYAAYDESLVRFGAAPFVELSDHNLRRSSEPFVATSDVLPPTGERWDFARLLHELSTMGYTAGIVRHRIDEVIASTFAGVADVLLESANQLHATSHSFAECYVFDMHFDAHMRVMLAGVSRDAFADTLPSGVGVAVHLTPPAVTESFLSLVHHHHQRRRESHCTRDHDWAVANLAAHHHVAICSHQSAIRSAQELVRLDIATCFTLDELDIIVMFESENADRHQGLSRVFPAANAAQNDKWLRFVLKPHATDVLISRWLRFKSAPRLEVQSARDAPRPIWRRRVRDIPSAPSPSDDAFDANDGGAAAAHRRMANEQQQRAYRFGAAEPTATHHYASILSVLLAFYAARPVIASLLALLILAPTLVLVHRLIRVSPSSLGHPSRKLDALKVA